MTAGNRQKIDDATEMMRQMLPPEMCGILPGEIQSWKFGMLDYNLFSKLQGYGDERSVATKSDSSNQTDNQKQ